MTTLEADNNGVLQVPVAEVFTPLLAPARYKGAYGGRGSGKSYFFADNLIERCLADTTRAVGIREVQKSLDLSVKQLIEDRIKNHWGVADEFRFLRSHIECPHGGIISFMGMQDRTAAAIRSLEGYDIAWVEEAQNLSQESLDTLRPTMRKPGSEIWFSWNPHDAADPVDMFFRGPKADKWKEDEIEKNLPPGAVLVRANWEDNPWFDDTELYEEMAYDRRRDPDKYQHIWLGGYLAHSEARVFHNWREEEFDTPEGVRFFFGADWGFGDPSVLVRMWIAGKRLYIDHEAYRVNCPIDELPALFMRIPGANKWPVRADSARPETIDYMKKRGFPRMSPSVKGKNSVEDGIEFLKTFDIVIHPRCRHTIDEFSQYSYKTDRRDKTVVLPVLEDKVNHCIDAARYALEGERLAPKVVKIPKAARQWARGETGEQMQGALEPSAPRTRRLIVPRRQGRLVIRNVR